MNRYAVYIYKNGTYLTPAVRSYMDYEDAKRLYDNTRLGGFDNVIMVKLDDIHYSRNLATKK